MAFSDTKLAVGDEIYIQDVNLRNGGDNIIAKPIVGETRVSWKIIINGRERSVNKHTGGISGELFGLHPVAWANRNDVEEYLFVKNRRHVIARMVGNCKDDAKLRAILAILEADNE
jgi:hypothetical protein